MTANAVGENLRMPVIERRDLQAVGVLNGRRQLIGGNRKLADRLRRNSVARLGTAPGHNAPAVDLGAHKCRPKLALLGITDRELGIGRKQKVGVRVVLQIMVNVGHAHFLIAAQQCAEGVARNNAVLEKVSAGVERQHCRALVVNHAATEQPASRRSMANGSVFQPGPAGTTSTWQIVASCLSPQPGISAIPT